MNKKILSLIVLCMVVSMAASVFAACVDAPGGMVSYWKFDDGSGTTAADSYGTNLGTVYGATWTTGQVGGALEFDGVDDYVEILDDDSLDVNTLTLEAWIKPDTLGVNFIMSKFGAVGEKSFEIYIDVNDKFHFTLPGCNAYGISTSTIEANIWTHVVATYDGTAAVVYVNGQEESKIEDVCNIYISTTNFAIGAYHYNLSLNTFDGTIDEAAIYNRALSAAEIQDYYQKGLLRDGFCGAVVDSDGDGISDDEDNCPENYNPDQVNSDSYGAGDVCDICPMLPTDTCDITGSTSTIIGTLGGTLVTSAGYMAINIPSSSLTQDTSISVTGGEVSHHSSIASLEAQTDTKAMSLIYSFGPEDTIFNPSATMTITYDLSELEESNWDIYRFNETIDYWEPQGATIDPVAKTATLNVDHFSCYAMTGGDGIPNEIDNCPETINGLQMDTDGDCELLKQDPSYWDGEKWLQNPRCGDACNEDSDSDGDEWADALDNCPDVFNIFQEDRDGNGVGDVCNDGEDSDGDDWADNLDNCADNSNPNQSDLDEDGLGDVCDPCTDVDHDAHCRWIDDCDDGNYLIHPGATDICDGIDNDCDSGTADGYGESWYNIETTCGVGECARTGNFLCENGEQINSCEPGDPDPEMCDDLDNGLDYDCDGCISVFDSDCGGGELEDANHNEIFEGCSDIDEDGIPIDTDCDGCVNKFDADCGGTEYADGDGGVYTPDGCTDTIDNDCDSCIDDGDSDCSMAETCNGLDDDGDGEIDEGFDQDNDGIADCFDNCLYSYNPGQADYDGDGKGDVCDLCPTTPNDVCIPSESIGIDIGSTGGTVNTGQASVDIPNFGLNTDTYITIEGSESTSSSNISSFEQDTGTTAISLIYTFGPIGMIFNREVTLSLKYDGGKIDESTADIFLYNTLVQQWTPQGAAINTIANIATINTTHFSDYIVGAKGDEDKDGIIDDEDKCLGTVIPESVPTGELNKNNYAEVDGDFVLEVGIKDGSEDSEYTIEETYGCTCSQILSCKPGNDNGEIKNGCTKGTMDNWVAQKGWAKDCGI